jgi:hypothetical protein
LHERLARVDVDVHRRGEAHNFAATDFMQSYFVAALHDVRFRVSTADFVAFDARVVSLFTLWKKLLTRLQLTNQFSFSFCSAKIQFFATCYVVSA